MHVTYLHLPICFKSPLDYLQYLLQCNCYVPCMLNCFSDVWLCATLWTVACQASLFMGFSRQEYWSRMQFPTPGDFPTQGSNLGFLHCRCVLCVVLPKSSGTEHTSTTLCTTSPGKPTAKWLHFNNPVMKPIAMYSWTRILFHPFFELCSNSYLQGVAWDRRLLVNVLEWCQDFRTPEVSPHKLNSLQCLLHSTLSVLHTIPEKNKHSTVKWRLLDIAQY